MVMDGHGRAETLLDDPYFKYSRYERELNSAQSVGT